MVAVAFFVDFVAVGFFFYSYGVFFKAIAAEFGGSRLGVSLGLTVTATVGAIAAPLLGNALDRYPLKRIIALGAIFMTLGFLALSFVRSPLEFYLAIGVFIGFGASAMGGLATAKLVANWFVRKRGMALGVAATGISASGVVMPFVSAALIAAYGWREGFMVYAAFTGLVVLPLVLKLVISSPEDVGLLPDGQLAEVGSAERAAISDAENTTNPILKERNFWVLVTVVGLLFCCQSATLTHMVPRITDAGIIAAGCLHGDVGVRRSRHPRQAVFRLALRLLARTPRRVVHHCLPDHRTGADVSDRYAVDFHHRGRRYSATVWAAWCRCRVHWSARCSDATGSARPWDVCGLRCFPCRSSAYHWPAGSMTPPAATTRPS